MSTGCFSSCFHSRYTTTTRRGRHRRLPDHDEPDDYLLPSSSHIQWDKDSKSFIKKDYVPPTIPHSSTGDSSLNINEFQLIKTLGKGAFGKVFLAAHTPSSDGCGRTLYAVKFIPKAKLTTEKHVQQIKAEMDILKKIKHPFCISLQFAFQNEESLFYVMEFAAGGMLLYHLREETRFSESRSRFYIGQIILALEYMHQLNIVFCDLKPENCMLNAIGHVIITDFGSAMKLQEGDTSSTIAGTPQYMAPEVLSGGQYNNSADWWSCGILLYEMLTGKTPFHSNNRVELYRAVLRGNFNIPFYVSPRARSLLFGMINRDPSKRGGVTDIKLHPFFSRTLMTHAEETQYASEERQPTTSAAGNIVRRLSHSAAHFTGSVSSIRGCPCEWDWVDLLTGTVQPPFIPKLTHPTDCRYFDPVITAVPPLLDDLATSSTPSNVGHVEGFDYNRLQEEQYTHSDSGSYTTTTTTNDNTTTTTNNNNSDDCVTVVTAEIHQ